MSGHNVKALKLRNHRQLSWNNGIKYLYNV